MRSLTYRAHTLTSKRYITTPKTGGSREACRMTSKYVPKLLSGASACTRRRCYHKAWFSTAAEVCHQPQETCCTTQLD
jgi:hypothetical protein